MSSGKLLLGVLAGVAAGALIGVLFAPEKGSDTRKKLSKKGGDYADDLKERFNGFLDEVKNSTETVKAKADEFMDNAASRVDHVKVR